MGESISEQLRLMSWLLGFSSKESMSEMMDHDGYEYFAIVSKFALQIGKPYGLASEMYDEGLDAVGNVEELEDRKRKLLNFLETTPFGQVHSWIVHMRDEAPE